MFKVYLVLFIIFAFSLQVSAQCSDAYFKESSRQVFSNPFAYSHFEDFDSDGLEDVLGFSSLGQGSFQIYFYNRLSSNAFDTVSKNTFITKVKGVFGIFGDVNNDGKKDIIAPHNTFPNATLKAYLNDGTGRFSTSTPVIQVDNNEFFWASGDLNNDGRADIISTTPNTGNTPTLNYRLAQANNSFGPAVPITTLTSSIATSANITTFTNVSITIEDLNNDGLKDIAFVTSSPYILKVLTNTGNLTFTETFSTIFTQAIKRLKAVDVNKDGKKDFISTVFQNTSNPNTFALRIAVNVGNNTFVNSDISVPAHYKYSFNYSVGDFDGDGDSDIILKGFGEYLVLKNQGNFTFTQQLVKTHLNINSIDNIDGDSKSDVISFIQPFLDGYFRLTTTNMVYSLSSAVSFRQNVCDPVGQTKIVDFDGDGFTDRAFWNPSTGIWRYYKDSAQNDQVYFKWGSGALGDVPVPNDYDGDGKTDYSVFRKSDGNWWIFRSSDQQAFNVKFGLSEDKPVPADYDGDSKADIAVYRPSEGIWYIWLSQSNQSQAIRFGISEDKPLPADYDGDGKADISVFRPSEGAWYRINSSNNSFFTIRFGISTDKPIPVDLDGDGKSNIAVFRDGAWYVLRDNFSTSIFYWGKKGDIPFFENGFTSMALVYRKTGGLIYSTEYHDTSLGVTHAYSTGDSFNEIFVSSIFPSE